ncbi:elongation factor Tu [Elysia marginata]|uniref:Elongation factor Tu n=1 Tax=Elysia marginata TaxID=1093978 RepID=A0AAV4JLF1_9GAST|nr:elongation factor Tu [Elysia marginata]
MKQAGYLTSWCNANPKSAPFNWRMLGFRQQPTDFYTRPYYMAVKKTKSKVANCVGGRTKSKVWLDYFRDIFLMYPHQRKFLFQFITDFSHDDNNLMTLMDADIKDVIQFLHEGNYLNNTLLILMGDHGARYANYRYTYSGKMEERLPYFGFLFPPWFEKKYPQAIKNLRTNTQRLTTPFDLYETFKDFFHFDGAGIGDISRRGISLFKEIPLSRSCKDADIAPHWCTCLDWREVSQDDPKTRKALQAALDTINGYTAPYRDDCYLLSVHTVARASKLKAGDAFLKFRKTDHDGGIYKISMSNTKQSHIIYYQIVFTTTPGMASFEVTIMYSTNTKKFTFYLLPLSIYNLTRRSCAPTTITYDAIKLIGSVGFKADDWLTGPFSLSAVLNFLRYGLRRLERARTA